MEMPSTISMYPTFQISTKSRQAFPIGMNFQKIGLVSLFFSSFLFVKVHKVETGYPNGYTERWCKGASWHQVSLEYGKHSQRYL